MRMAVIPGQAGEKTEPGFCTLRTVEAGESDGHVQHAHDGRAERTGICELRTGGIRARDAALPVRRTGKRDARPCAG